MVRPLPLKSVDENESEQRMTVGKLSPNLDGFALFHHQIINEALKWRWICLQPDINPLVDPVRLLAAALTGERSRTSALGRVEIL